MTVQYSSEEKMSRHSSESDSVSDRNRDRGKRDHDRDRRYDRDRDRHRDRDRDRDTRDRGDRDRDRNREERRGRDREHRSRSNEDRDRHSRHNRDHSEELDDSRGSDDWPGRRHSSQDSRGRWNDSIPNNIILMRGLPAEAVESDVVSELLKTGTVVKDVRLMRNKETGYSLRYCFVEFHTLPEAQYWMELNEGKLLFMEKYPINMYYSYSRRGNLNNTVSQPPTDASLADTASDWTCIKCSCKNFQRRIFCRRCNNSRLESERVSGGDGLDQVGSNPCNTLILRGLDGLTTAENITAAFASLTSMPLKNVRVIHDRATGVSNGFAFVELNSLKESQDLLEYLETLTTPLEVDGKALMVAYAKNTFSTALATLDQSFATQSIDYNQQKPGGFHDYNSYYNYNPPTADSTNAAEVAQAAILASQQKKYKTNPSVVTAAPVLHSSQPVAPVVAATPEYQQYPVPDVSTYQYDETSGYYYDASTGLYYDANSQYYYNSQTQQYLYWDGERQTYLPAPTASTDTTDATAAANDQKKEEEKKRPQSPDKKVKVAKRIVKDMEKWAKKLNAQKDQLRDMTKTTAVAQPTVAEPVSYVQPTSAAADAGFSLLERTVSNKRAAEVAVKPAVEVLPSPSPSTATQSLYSKSEMEQMPSTSALESSSNVMSVEELIDWEKLACLLCRRAFPSRDILLKHQQMSELHKKNVDDLIQAKGGGLSHDGSTLQYRDRARERRQKYGVPEPPQPKRGRMQAEKEPVPFEQPTASGIKEDNIGNKLLQKMGWQEGRGLGQRGQGIVDPIEAKQRQAQAGLGARGSAYNVDPGVGTYKERARKTFYHYFQEIN